MQKGDVHSISVAWAFSFGAKDDDPLIRRGRGMETFDLYQSHDTRNVEGKNLVFWGTQKYFTLIKIL